MLPNPAVNQTYTVNMDIINKIIDLVQKTGMNKSEIVRQAVDELYQRMMNHDTPAETPASN